MENNIDQNALLYLIENSSEDFPEEKNLNFRVLNKALLVLQSFDENFMNETNFEYHEVSLANENRDLIISFKGDYINVATKNFHRLSATMLLADSVSMRYLNRGKVAIKMRFNKLFKENI